MAMKDLRKKAKKEKLLSLKKDMLEEMHEDMKEPIESKQMEKVTVMSDSPEGLKEGLSKAQEILEKRKKERKNDEEYACGGYKSKK